eukprot:TRINITY_DN11614_c1_g1_i6.p1 TRINITY_DN11614_c1_g1~~TRINITY_DN11614_c1_g1_i6.p1  ORF type:complete len:427 (-),score=63.14 TRINITY_DN11614_c1_g1_i6:997-2277(-)
MASQPVNMYCINCDENVAFENGDDGFFYCHMCGSQSQDVVDTTGLGDHLFLSGIYNRAHMLSQPKIKTEPWLTQTQTQFFPPPTITKQEKEEEQKPYSFEDESFVPLDFGNPWMNQAPPLDDETVVKSLRLRYVQGIQVMIQLQCQVLVERFSVSPAICGLSGALWLRYISVSRVFDKDWAKDTILDSEEAFHGRVDATQLHMFDYSKDLLSYLKYCKDVVFAGLTTSFEEDNFIEQLWNLYETQEDIKPSVEPGTGCCIPKRSRDEGNTIDSTDCQQSTDGPVTRMKSRTKGHHSLSMDDDINNQTWMSPKEEALRQIKSDMELDKLHYLPPRSKSKNRSGYVCYARKAMRGKWNYVADADYYILLRTCARLTQIDIRVMHLGALKLEKRLLWIEKRVDDSLRLSSGLSSELKDKDFPDCDDMLD